MAVSSQVHVSNLKQFDGTGFSNWEFRMKLILEQSDVDEAILETITPTRAAENEFKKKDVKARNIIVQCLSDNVLETVKNKTTAREMYKHLCETYRKTGLVTQVELQRKLRCMKFERGNLTEFLNEFERTVSELRSSGGTIPDEEVISQLLAAMPEKYQAITATIDVIFAQNPRDITFQFVKNRLLQEETRHSETNRSSMETVAFATRRHFNRKFGNNTNSRGNYSSARSGYSGGHFRFRCYNCGKHGHKRNECPESRKVQLAETEEEEVVFIADCEKASFEKEEEIQMKGDNHSEVLSMKNDSRQMCLSTNSTGCDLGTIKFIVDSGATNHLITKNVGHYLINVKDIEHKITVAKRGETVTARKQGNLPLIANEGKVVTLENVLQCEDLVTNLLSVKKIEEKGLCVMFKNGKVLIEKDKNIIMQGELIGNMYVIEMKFRIHYANSAVVGSEELLHKRMGHSFKYPSEGICEICLKGKQNRKPFLKKLPDERKADDMLQVVSSDVCGKINPPTYNGMQYYVSFINNYSHFAMVYQLKKKSEVINKFKEYVALVETKTNKKVQAIRCDNGGEYSGKDFKNFCKEKGIEIIYSIPRNPEQNGISERFNRTILDKSRCMIFEAKLDKIFWGDAILTAVYLYNRLPTSTLPENRTPAEIWYGYEPDLTKIKNFGCVAYAHKPKEDRQGKLDTHSRKMIFVGYCNNGYRLWNPETNSIVTARSVIFDEKSTFEPRNDSGNIRPILIHESIEENQEEEREVDVEEYRDEIEVEIENNQEDVNVRKSNRKKSVPRNLQDYDLSNDDFNEANLMAALSVGHLPHEIPKTYDEAIEKGWESAVNNEILTLKENNTWEIVLPPPDVKLIDSKWVFSEKLIDGNLVKKARLVARGYQQPTLEDEILYAPVARLATLRVLLSLAVEEDLNIHQLDVKSAFLNSTLDEAVYMKPPCGLKAYLPGQVCKLRKALYGLKQSPKCWYDFISQCLLELNLIKSKVDPCMFFSKNVFLLMWVDDFLILSKSISDVERIKYYLSNKIDIKDLTNNNLRFLGLEIERCDDKIKISQKLLISKVLDYFKMNDCKTSKIPIQPKLDLKRDEPNLDYKVPYKELIGSLMYIMLGSRPDLCFSVGYFSRFQNCYSEVHWKNLKNILRYLKHTQNFSLVFYKSHNLNCNLYAYVDSDFAGDVNDRKSTSGFCIKINKNMIFWHSKKQSIVAISSSEAEYVALASCVTECLFILQLLENMSLEIIKPIEIYEDNQACIKMAQSFETKRSKHIDVRHHFLKDLVNTKIIRLQYISTENQVADIFTKALSANKFNTFCKELNLSG